MHRVSVSLLNLWYCTRFLLCPYLFNAKMNLDHMWYAYALFYKGDIAGAYVGVNSHKESIGYSPLIR